MFHFRTKVLTSLLGVLYSVMKAVPGFLKVSKLWQWLISSAVALFSGPSNKRQRASLQHQHSRKESQLE
eukprot:3399360-Amphidinium_carterae.1